MPSKLTEGLIPNIDACKTGAGLSRGPNLCKKLVSSAWSPTWPAPGATLDLDFVNNRGYIFGQGQGGVMDAISFTRASSGTYIGSDGLLKNGGGLGKNLLSFPQDFNNALWTTTNATVIANAATAPDGTQTANLLISNTLNNQHYIANSSALNSIIPDNVNFTLSCYFKSNGRSTAAFSIRLKNSTFATVQYNLLTESLTSSSNIISTNITAAENGFYRIAMVANSSSGVGNMFATIGDTFSTYIGDNVSGIYIWGAQLELGSTATQYYPTNVNQPRFDWASTVQTSNKNLLNYTELLTNAYWFKTNLTVSASTVLGDGSFNLVPSNGTFASGTSNLQNSGWYANAAYTFAGINTAFSFYVAANGANYFQINIGVQPNRFAGLNIDLTNGTATTGGIGGTLVSYTITPQTVGYYVTLVVNLAFGTIGSTPSFFISTTPMTTGFSPSITGNGASGVVIKYPQFEVGSTPTAYQAIGSASPSTTPLTPTSTSNGILIEEQRTNLALWSRDATQTVWTKTNITATLNQTGIDGVANSATSLTATAANAACIQTTTATSSTKTISIFLKAITVTGAIQVSIDGSTWSTADLSNGLWNRIILTAALANPVLGILIQNSGDAVAMDYAQMEAASFVTTPIYTSSATATRATDFATIPNNITKNFFNWNSGTIFAKGVGIPINTSGNIVNIGDGTYYRGVALNFAGSLVVGLTRTSDSFTFPGASAINLPYSLTLNTWNSFSLAGSWSMSRVSASIFGRTTVFANNVGYAPLNYGAYFFDISSAAGSTNGTNCKYFSRIILWPKAVSDSTVQLISGETT